MARYIDADKLEYDLQQKRCSKCNMYDGLKCKTCEIDDVFYYLTNAPTEDVIPKSEVEELSGKYEDLKLRYIDLAKDRDELIAWGGHIKSKDRAVIREQIAREIFEEIEREINDALQSNYKVLPLIEESEALWNRVNGKIDALRGIGGFIDELKEKYTEDKNE